MRNHQSRKPPTSLTHSYARLQSSVTFFLAASELVSNALEFFLRSFRPSVRPSIHRLTHALTRGVTSLLVVLDGDGVHAVPGVGGGLEPLALEDVAQVPTTVAADNLDAHAVGVGNLLDGPR